MKHKMMEPSQKSSSNWGGLIFFIGLFITLLVCLWPRTVEFQKTSHTVNAKVIGFTTAGGSDGAEGFAVCFFLRFEDDSIHKIVATGVHSDIGDIVRLRKWIGPEENLVHYSFDNQASYHTELVPIYNIAEGIDRRNEFNLK